MIESIVRDLRELPPPKLVEVARYVHGLNGNRISKTLENGTVTTYPYDMASRWTQVAHSAGSTNLATVGYTLDAVGDRTRVTGSVPGAGAYTANHLNQSTAAGGDVLLHETKGNLCKRGLAWNYAYDSKNRLLSATKNQAPGTVNAVFTYDHQNRQVSRTVNGTTTYFIYDGWSLIEERDATGALVQKYVHGAQIDERGSRQRQKAEPAGGDTAWGTGTWPEILWKQNTAGEVYYHQDGLGSTIALTDETGALIESYHYDAFGTVTIFDPSTLDIRPSTAHSNRFLFTGREWIGEIGLYDYRNRAYSPELGRFLQTDPIRFNAGDVNLYRYVSNSAVDWVDPLGLATIDPECLKECVAQCKAEYHACRENIGVDYAKGWIQRDVGGLLRQAIVGRFGVFRGAFLCRRQLRSCEEHCPLRCIKDCPDLSGYV